jgi:hypothetical protein
MAYALEPLLVQLVIAKRLLEYAAHMPGDQRGATAGLNERAAAHLDWLSRLVMRLSALPLPFLPFIPRLRWLLIGALLTGW